MIVTPLRPYLSMLKRILFTAAIAAVSSLSPSVSSGQAVDPFPSAAPQICLLTPNLFSIAPSKCFGFFDKNSGVQAMDALQVVSLTSNRPAFDALMSFGFSSSGSYSVIERIGSWPSNADFSTMLSGWTVVGFHWGNYPDDYEGTDAIGNVSAWYLFNVTTPTKDLNVLDTQGISNATVIFTNGECTANGCGPRITSVPEPSTYALMATGLLGIFGFARRRRNNA